jgi:hypothetical protein
MGGNTRFAVDHGVIAFEATLGRTGRIGTAIQMPHCRPIYQPPTGVPAPLAAAGEPASASLLVSSFEHTNPWLRKSSCAEGDSVPALSSSRFRTLDRR